MALDEPTDNDTTVEANGFTFCIEKDLLERVGGVKIDVSYMGFVVESELPLANSGSSCGSCGSSCH